MSTGLRPKLCPNCKSEKLLKLARVNGGWGCEACGTLFEIERGPVIERTRPGSLEAVGLAPAPVAQPVAPPLASTSAPEVPACPLCMSAERVEALPPRVGAQQSTDIARYVCARCGSGITTLTPQPNGDAVTSEAPAGVAASMAAGIQRRVLRLEQDRDLLGEQIVAAQEQQRVYAEKMVIVQDHLMHMRHNIMAESVKAERAAGPQGHIADMQARLTVAEAQVVELKARLAEEKERATKAEARADRMEKWATRADEVSKAASRNYGEILERAQVAEARRAMEDGSLEMAIEKFGATFAAHSVSRMVIERDLSGWRVLATCRQEDVLAYGRTLGPAVKMLLTVKCAEVLTRKAQKTD